MTIKIDNAQFKTAQENMDYDETLLELKERTSICRLYQWQNQPSITLPYNRPLPTELIDIDHAHRPTGGGIVFHNPGDLLFTIIASMKDPAFPAPFKEKLQWISTQLHIIFNTLGYQITTLRSEKERDITFCNRYPNPYEIYINNEKVVGLAQRRFKNQFMVQGIIHIQSNLDAFKNLPKKFHPYLTQGLKGDCDYIQLQDSIRNNVTQS